MTTWIKFLLFLINIPFFNAKSLAQPELWDVYTTSNQPFINVVISTYRSDTLYLRSMDRLIALHQDSLKFLIQRKESKFDIGLIIGFLVGGIVGVLVNSNRQGWFFEAGSSTNFFGAIILGGIFGGALGAAVGTDTKYYLDRYKPEAKRSLLKKLFGINKSGMNTMMGIGFK